MRCIKAVLLLLLLPSLVQADGVLTPAANPPDERLYDYRNSILLQDDFFSGNTTAGSIGQLGWTTSNGTNSYTAISTNRMGLFTRDTTASSGTSATMILNSTSNVLDPSAQYKLTFVQKLNQVDANTTFWSGAANSSTVSVPNDGIYIEKRDADTNWFCVTRASSTQTRTDSGVAITTNYVTLTEERTGSSVKFYINGALVCTHTTNIPTTGLDPAAFLINSAAASKTYINDYFELRITGLAR